MAHEVTNAVIDRRQLARMAKRAKVVLAPESDQTLSVIADQGYVAV